MIRKNIYKWHRTISLIIAIPVCLWAISGFLHPIMTNIRPKVATQWLMPVAIDSNKITVPLQTALTQNGIDSFQTFRIVHINNDYFYQVKLNNKIELQYYSTLTGKLLANGDWLYAQYLAKQFLEGQKKDSSNHKAFNTNIIPITASHDCCNAATNFILNGKTGSKVKSVDYVQAFDKEYNSINRLLPVYRVEFDREDGIRIFVETGQDRFATAIDNNRYAFTLFFQLIHNMGWLDFLGNGRLVIEVILSILTFLTSLIGIYIFFTTKSKKVVGNDKVTARRNHRYTSVFISLFTLLFSFSGGFHAFSKFKEDVRDKYFIQNNFAVNQINFNFSQLKSVAKQPITNINLVRINGSNYWQVTTNSTSKKPTTSLKGKDMMKDMSVPPPSNIYISTNKGSVLIDGEKQYANFLATSFSNHLETEIKATTVITKLEKEYNFTDKRLPVWKVQYTTNHNERFYVETLTGKLSKKTDDTDIWDALSFNFLHKHHFMDFAGKGWRDFSTMFWAASQIAMVVIGLILYFKTRKKNNK